MSLAPARRLALDALGEVRRRSGWVRPILDAALDDSVAPRDASLARALAIGTTQMRGSMDFAIDHWASKPGSIEPRVRDALRVAAYEILFMSTPHEVAVDQGVEAVRTVTPRATGLANAILRRISEHAAEFPWDVSDDTARTALLTGHPEWLVTRLHDDLGASESTALLEANNTPPPLFLATNDALTDDEALEYALSTVDAVPEPYGPPGCFRIGEPSKAISSGLIAQEHAVVSDAAAQTVAGLCVSSKDSRIIEIGAGRGTKTILLLSNAHREGMTLDLTCIDSDSRKLEELRERAARAGYESPTTHELDASAPIPTTDLPLADCVLVDAPCSGLGTLRRHPEKRWDLTPDAIDSLAALQSMMLGRAAELVRPGGFMVYSTCTVLKAENDDVVDDFLNSELGSAFKDGLDPERVPEEFHKWVTEEGRLQTLPTRGGPDGHYAAVLARDS